ncbi:Predicted nucleotidyltransferase [Gracilibacillus ureilyticus]|uniref:tRNA(Met) cytidine acetate ligase n=1 Tax=Gracilibacillus ureilyticus TaxID=531814 RepID=A0A1H9TIH1_9BACI|nr:nucleotidyltransferase [Gracilibacillus ureilyticus]SER96774.1 Predicted nucleotidyltransferase [Gracilibacillus ureilyticus]
MRGCGLIVEYNPFHNGHKYHLNKSKAMTNADCMIAVMSGNFLQRGEPAVIDKHHRAQLAVSQGADLVIELPYYYAVQHSELFAEGAIRILSLLKADSICFGSEHGEINEFYEIINLINGNYREYHQHLKNALKEGNAYPAAHEAAYRKIGGNFLTIDFTKPNNVLGTQYLEKILQIDPSIQPFTIKRQQNEYHDQSLTKPFASATSIRKELFSNKPPTDIAETVPIQTTEILNNYRNQFGGFHSWDQYFSYLRYRILTINTSYLKQIHGVKEGLENRLIRSMKDASNFQQFMTNLKTKRYTWTSLQRILVNIITNITKADIEEKLSGSPPLRILAMSATGKEYLHNLKNEEIKFYTSNKKPYPDYDLDNRIASAYYSILETERQIIAKKQDFKPPFIKA